MPDPVQLSRFRADVSRALARQGKNLLSAPDLAARVAALEPLEIYFVVKELGVEDSLPILRHAHAEQIQAFVDLDCWHGDEPDPVEIDAWLAPFAADGKESLARAFGALESEVQILFLKHALCIYDARSEDVPPALKTTPRLTTPDGFFVVDALLPDKLEVNVLSLVDGLYAVDIGEAFRLLTAVKWELPSPLAERAFQFRSNRLEDLGFPKPAEARAIFTAPPPAPPARRLTPVPTNLPAIYAASIGEGNLLARALARIAEPDVLDAVESDLVYLINAAVIAYGEAPRDLRHVTDIAERVRDTVSLGLEVLLEREENTVGLSREEREENTVGLSRTFLEGEKSAANAAAAVRTWPLRDIFRHGHQAVTQLKAAAVALAEDPAVSEWLETVETEPDDYNSERLDRELVRALLLPSPLYGGFDRLAPGKRKAFGSLRELQTAEQVLHRKMRKK